MRMTGIQKDEVEASASSLVVVSRDSMEDEVREQVAHLDDTTLAMMYSMLYDSENAIQVGRWTNPGDPMEIEDDAKVLYQGAVVMDGYEKLEGRQPDKAYGLELGR